MWRAHTERVIGGWLGSAAVGSPVSDVPRLTESYREIASSQAETYVSVVSNKTNDVMKVLTIIGTIFIPLTFLAGVYGMNMPIPENASPLAYPLFWLVGGVVATSMVVWFRRRGWL